MVKSVVKCLVKSVVTCVVKYDVKIRHKIRHEIAHQNGHVLDAQMEETGSNRRGAEIEARGKPQTGGNGKQPPWSRKRGEREATDGQQREETGGAESEARGKPQTRSSGRSGRSSVTHSEPAEGSSRFFLELLIFRVYVIRTHKT